MIPISALERTATELMAKAAIEIPDDYLAGLRRCADTEKGDLSAFVIQAMLENYEAAKEDRRAMCGDTGVPRWYVKIGNEARIEGGPVALEAALRRATATATQEVPLRPNRVHPLWRTDHNNNVGINAPEIEYAFHPDAEWIDLTTVHKGGLFGSDYRMLFPGDGIDGIKRFYLDTLIAFGKRGLACQPAIVGVGLGGSKDICMILGKQASCLRTVGSCNPDPRIAALEDELEALGNSIGMGAMGFMGTSMVVDCHIEVGYCHTGGMPMSVHMFCLSSRRATARVYADGRCRIPYRSHVVHGVYAALERGVGQPGRGGSGVSHGGPRDRSSGPPGKPGCVARPRDRLGRLSHRARVHGARRRLQARDRGRRRHAGVARGARSRQFSLLAGRVDRRRRQAYRRRGDRDGVVPLRQVARRLARDVGLQSHHRQGWHDLRDLSEMLCAERGHLSHDRGLRHRRTAGSRHQAGGRGLIGSRSSDWRRPSGCSKSRISVRSWSRAIAMAILCSSARTPRSHRGSSGSIRAPGRQSCAASARPTTRPKS